VGGDRILVTGGTGRVGSGVVAALAGRTARPVTVFVRDPARLGPLPAGVTARRGDLRVPADLRAALDGVATMFLLTPDDPAQDEWEIEILATAAAAGVGRVVKLSAHSAGCSPPRSFGRLHRRAEEALADGGMRWTVLRPTFFLQSLLLFAGDISARGWFAAPVRRGRVAAVDARDVAEAAAVVLADDDSRHDGATLELTGPQAVSFAEVAAAVGAVTRRTVRFRPLPRPVARAVLPRATGMPRWMAAHVVDLFAAIEAGAQSRPTATLSALLGRPPRTLGDFVADHREHFAPAAAVAR